MSKPAVRVIALGHGVFQVERADGTHGLAYGATAGETTWVFIEGSTYVFEPARTARSSAAHDASALAAPMPATVAQIHVTPGQAVVKGDVLVTLEAMKMELPIRASANGTVAAINCRVGERVQPGVALVELRTPEPAPNQNQNPNPNPEPEPEPRTEPRT